MTELKLRPYQAAALEEIRDHYRKGTKKVLLHLATGGGKTLCFCQILKGAHEKGSFAMMVVSGAALVDQASVRLDREKVPHGVQQAMHWRRFPDERIQICSIQTLYRRKSLPKADIIVIDEAHLASSPMFIWLIENYPEAYILAVTATPYTKKGMRHIADAIVRPIGINELIEQGFLVRPRYYIPSKVNLGGLSIDAKTGDYKTSDLETRVSDANIFGDIVAAWNQYGKGRPTLCFAVSISHSLQLVENFNKAGIRAVHVEASTPKAEREKAIKDLEDKVIDVISNVGILTTGVDIPCVSCIILARPTRSYNLYIQTCGRGTRPFEGKKDFIILDHGACVQHHGFIEHEQEVDLDGKPKKKGDSVSITVCPSCYMAYQGQDNCPACGSQEKAERSRKYETDATVELVEVKALTTVPPEIEYYIERCLRMGYNQGWVYHQVKERFGEAYAKQHWREIKKRMLSVAARQFSEKNNLSAFSDSPL